MNWFQFLTGVYVGGAFVMGYLSSVFGASPMEAIFAGVIWPVVVFLFN